MKIMINCESVHGYCDALLQSPRPCGFGKTSKGLAITVCACMCVQANQLDEIQREKS